MRAEGSGLFILSLRSGVNLVNHTIFWHMNDQTGGLSNRQKEHKKAMPLAAKRSKVARTRMEKKKKQQRSGKQFRGRKAWK